MNEIKKINVDGVDYDIVSKELTKITYAELKALRDNGQLSEGHLYRITDYVTTTTQAETKSAGNVFDVIVLAVSASELSHIARAIQHEGDTYFDGNDLGAWELWYDLDNDTDKYEWADATNGKGVIYRMIDEKANDCPYDFKNILFYKSDITSYTTEDNYYYTFSYVVSGKLYDESVEKQVNSNCFLNSMGARIYFTKRRLLFNVFRSTTFGNYCYNNTLGNNCYNNIFGYSCTNNTFGNDCTNNTFGNQCHHNTFGLNCYNNTLGLNCYNNTFRDYSNGYKVEPIKTMSEEFYDDGSGKLVPVKHPELSTQPSILPYKFMGQYVYEQLIPHDGDSHHRYNTWFALQDLAIQNPMFLDAQCVMSDGVCPCDIKVQGYEVEAESNGQREGIKYVRVVYTSMPDEEGDYYGYNNY